MPATLEQIEAQVTAYNPDADLTGLDEAYDFAVIGPRGAVAQERRAVHQPSRRGRASSWPSCTSTRRRSRRRCCTTSSRTRDVTLDEVRERFGDEVAELVDGVTKLGRIEFESLSEQQSQQPAQDAHRDGQGHPGHPHQARRPAAQHAHARGAAARAAHRQGARDDGDLRAARAPARHQLRSSGSSRTWPSTTSSRIKFHQVQTDGRREPRRARGVRRPGHRPAPRRARRRWASRRRSRAAQAPLQHLPEDGGQG